jgi:hypothetical protein
VKIQHLDEKYFEKYFFLYLYRKEKRAKKQPIEGK